MCFSASASFTAGTLLTIIGIASIKKTGHRSQLLFAGIPFIFGIQQLAEGVLWLTIPNPDYITAQKIATHIFLFFAQVLWPIWVPIAILLLEKNITRKNTQRILVIAGLTVGGYLAYCLCVFHVEAKISESHIMYIQDYPASLGKYSILLYALATIIPPFFSHIKRMWMLGAAIFISYLVSALFYEHYILSVWCFFASIISFSIYIILLEIANSEQRKKS